MITTTAAYKNAIRYAYTQSHQLLGSLTIGSGSPIVLAESNFLEDSLSITNQICSSGSICIGSAYTGQLNCTLLLDSIRYTSLKDAIINLSMAVNVSGNYQEMPLGQYVISSAMQTDEGIQITAYDFMIKFDKKKVKKSDIVLRSQTAYNWYVFICSKCGVTPRMTSASDFSKFWCGNKTLYLNEKLGSVTTYRGLVAMLAQALCAFAVIDRYGKLDLVPLYSEPDVQSTLTTSMSIIDSYKVSDTKIMFGGFYLKYTADSSVSRYFGYTEQDVNIEISTIDAEITEYELHITDLNAEIARIDSLIEKLDIDYAAGKITQQEYQLKRTAYEEEKLNIEREELNIQLVISDLQQDKVTYQNNIQPSLANANSMDLGYNPFIANSFSNADKWSMAQNMTYARYAPYTYQMVGDIGFELGDVVYVDTGGSSLDTMGMIMSYEFDMYCVNVEGFGADSEMQSAKALETAKMQSSINELSASVAQCFQSVSSGKNLVASAVTDKGVYTPSDATFMEIARNIDSLIVGGGETHDGYIDSYHTVGGDCNYTVGVEETYNVT